jgi:hypothetical protein
VVSMLESHPGIQPRGEKDERERERERERQRDRETEREKRKKKRQNTSNLSFLLLSSFFFFPEYTSRIRLSQVDHDAAVRCSPNDVTSHNGPGTK